MHDRLVRFVLLLPCLAMLACRSGGSPPPSDGRREIRITVTDHYEPASVSAAPGERVRLLFTRTSDEGCGQQVVFPELDIRRDLPLGEPVAIDITMPERGRVSFTCGMAMYEGAIVVQ